MKLNNKQQPAQAAPVPAQTEAEKLTVAATDVAVIPQTSTEVGEAIDFSQYAGMGSENVRVADKAVPYLVILQKNSPQVDVDSDKYVNGATVGMIYNTVTGELFDGKTEGIFVIPCNFDPKVVEWVPRDAGGGFVAAFDHGDPEVVEAMRENLRNDKNKLINRKGNTMIDTAYHYVLHVIDGAPHPSIISMTSTQHKPSRSWNSLIDGIMLPVPGQSGRKYNPPRFSHVYHLTTAVQKNGEFTSYNWRIALVGPVTDRLLFQAALTFSQGVAGGTVNVAPPPSEDEASAPAGKTGDGRGEKPF